ncbi:MAG TPA: hydroxymethylbilane synthase [Aliidongia sp.]|uniref:hydroxymethylbilane synthase n=1 Tax=Aliidongia sp. TaxID=1914230 RepID=UPI002DDDA390|nr:hydroxymethylbilane synthase [Aliidongia sp.]HEV2677823.1 hydroxymethylbilane synthase [Aliidongia sp.]
MSSDHPLLRIGTRGSALALVQAEMVRALLMATHPELASPDAVAISIIRTTGDAVTDRTLAAIGGKGLFTKEIEDALIDGRVDLAVHSMKDVATWLPDGLVIDCFLEREDPRDAFFSDQAADLLSLRPGAVVGTASLRRQAQVLRLRPDLSVVPIRGNVDTRLAKLASGQVDATLLATAGLKRLGQTDRITQILPPELMLPAVAQGVIGIERRAADPRVEAYLRPLNHQPTAIRVAAERALLASLDGSCKTPIAALAELDAAGVLRLRSLIVTPDGTVGHADVRSGSPAEAAALGRAAGAALRARAGSGFFDLPVPDAPVR